MFFWFETNTNNQQSIGNETNNATTNRQAILNINQSRNTI